jgi:hypothetical protein
VGAEGIRGNEPFLENYSTKLTEKRAPAAEAAEISSVASREHALYTPFPQHFRPAPSGTTFVVG